MESEIIHIPELAMLLSRTEASIRSARQVGAPWLPPCFKQGNRVCWRLSTVREFLKEFEAAHTSPSKAGARRKTPPSVANVR